MGNQGGPADGRTCGGPRRITNWVDSHFWGLSTTTDRKRLAFLKGNPQSDVYVGELEAKGRRLKTPRRLTLDEHQDIPSAWTPDSKAVLFVSDRMGSFNIFKQALDEDTAEPLTSGSEVIRKSTASVGGVPRRVPRRFVDSVFGGLEKGGSTPSALHASHADAGGAADRASWCSRLEALTSTHCARAPATLCVLGERSADGKQLLLTTFDPLKGRGHEVGKIKVRMRPGTVSWDLSPDASRIAFSEFDEHEGRIHFLSLTGGTIADLVVPGWVVLLAQ